MSWAFLVLGVLIFAVLCWISHQLDVLHQLVRNSAGLLLDKER